MFQRYVILAAPVCCLLSIVQVSLFPQDSSAEIFQIPSQIPIQNSPGVAPPKGLDDKLLDGLPAGPSKTRQETGSAHDDRATDAATTPPGTALDPLAEGSDLGSPNPLAQIGRGMLQAEQRLMQRDVSSSTQQAQRQIVTELDELIAALAAQQQSAGAQKRSPSSPDDQQASPTGKQAARDSDSLTGKDETRAAETAAMRQAVGEIWGHLPERFRSQMQNAGAIEFLPQYRKLIEDYYQRLAEDRRLQ